MNLLTTFKPIKLFVLDVDGVLTNGTILLLDNGEQARTMNIKDGYAMQLAVKKGYHFLIISGGKSDAVVQRLQKLGVQHIEMGVHNKVEVLHKYLQQLGLHKEQVLMMGDDMPDIEAMQQVGVACAPADAVQEVKNIAHYISEKEGGNTCVRDVIEKVLKLNNHWNNDFSVPST
jgi:3-deoxy-D-manno-octulosonate 8-phosphate phosphatase (KDO 8-P phosphatase)